MDSVKVYVAVTLGAVVTAAHFAVLVVVVPVNLNATASNDAFESTWYVTLCVVLSYFAVYGPAANIKLISFLFVLAAFAISVNGIECVDAFAIFTPSAAASWRTFVVESPLSVTVPAKACADPFAVVIRSRENSAAVTFVRSVWAS